MKYAEGLTLCLADDLTGALEVGALFASAGLRSRVTTRLAGHHRPAEDAMVFDTETRHSDPHASANTIRELMSRLALLAEALVYKKTDSTLRGNIGVEVAALHTCFPEREVLYVPAYPALGRTVRDGMLFVDGVLLHQSEFAADHLNPVTASSVAAALHPASGTVVDGETEDDVRNAANRVRREPWRYIVAGPAAVARYLAVAAGNLPPAELPNLASLRLLVVNGSRHPASRVQIDSGRRNGIFEQTRWTEFASQEDRSGLARAASVGENVANLMRGPAFDGILVFGGDTAYGIHAALGSEDFVPMGEIIPGVAVSQSNGGLFWVTKAGGFGPADLLSRLIQSFSR